MRAPRAWRAFLLAVGFAVAADPAPAQLPTDPAESLQTAHGRFLVADYAGALSAVDGLISSGGLKGASRVDAHVLQARCQIGLERRLAGVDAFCSVLRLAPDWRPALGYYTRDEMDVFGEAFEICGPLDEPVRRASPFGPQAPDRRVAVVSGPRPWYRSPLFLGAAGSLVAGLALLTIGGDEAAPPQSLPDFPSPPE